MQEVAFQDRMPGNHCFGSGAGNESGLRIKSHWVGERESICRFRPQPHQAAGPRGDCEVEVRARVRDVDGRKSWLDCRLISAGELCAEGSLLAVRVDPSFLRRDAAMAKP